MCLQGSISGRKGGLGARIAGDIPGEKPAKLFRIIVEIGGREGDRVIAVIG
jgi:hypothetical protein